MNSHPSANGSVTDVSVADVSVADISPNSTPQRLSTLYQYHNAPEVAPAHGLEYDDTVYPVSDKYPVVHQYSPPSYKGKDAYAINNNNRPPRIIFGMKVRTFIVVAVIFTLVLIGAAVGGAVGGKNMQGGSSSQADANANAASAATTSSASSGAQTLAAASSTSSTAAAVTPTYVPITDCPTSNDTSYISTYSTSSSSSGLNFTKYCGTASPLSSTGFSAKTIAQAFVYTFDDCIEICAGYNHYASNSNCTVAVYEVGGSRPGNCQVGYATIASHNDLAAKSGTAVALLET